MLGTGTVKLSTAVPWELGGCWGTSLVTAPEWEAFVAEVEGRLESGKRVARGCHGVCLGPALSSLFEDFASKAAGSHGYIFKGGNGVTSLGSSVESGRVGSKVDLHMVVRRPCQWPGAEVILVAERQGYRWHDVTGCGSPVPVPRR